MRTKTITIVDYQMGNLRSVQKALESVGAHAIVSSDPETISQAEKLVLPGVGGFGDAISELRRLNLAEPIVEVINSGRPMLGICLGLQLLFDVGYEHGTNEGLHVLGGDVVQFSGDSYSIGTGLKVPHMGWNQVAVKKNDCPLFNGISEDSYFYFVHSFFVQPKESDVVWLECNYGRPFCAAAWKDNVYATQFHPEKSQANGLKLLGNFASL